MDTLQKVVPKPTYDEINNKIKSNFNPVFDYMFYDLLKGCIIRDFENLDNYFEVKEGIENKIYANIFKCNTLDELISSTKSKRYTLTKIKRTLNNILLGIEKEDVMKTKNLCKV